MFSNLDLAIKRSKVSKKNLVSLYENKNMINKSMQKQRRYYSFKICAGNSLLLLFYKGVEQDFPRLIMSLLAQKVKQNDKR